MGEAVATPGIAGQAPAQLFSRESSGLVRVGSPWRMLLLNVANIGVVYIMHQYLINKIYHNFHIGFLHVLLGLLGPTPSCRSGHARHGARAPMCNVSL